MRIVTDFSVVSVRRNRPSGPALSLDFATGTYLAKGQPKTLAQVMTFARSGSALRLTATGVLETLAADQPRFDHAETGAARGLLVEAAAANLVLNNTSAICAVWWQSGGDNPPAVLTTLRGLVAKSFTRTSNTFCNPDVSSGPFAVTPGQSVVFSFWAASPNAAQIKPAIFNVNNGTWLVGHTFSDTTVTLEPGGKRYSYTCTIPAGCTQIQPKFDYSAVSAVGATITVTAPQVEVGAVETSTIITGASAVTRAADVPGLLGLPGTHDVTLTYDDLSVQTLLSQTIPPGWWPAMSRPWLRSMVIS